MKSRSSHKKISGRFVRPKPYRKWFNLFFLFFCMSMIFVLIIPRMNASNTNNTRQEPIHFSFYSTLPGAESNEKKLATEAKHMLMREIKHDL